MILFIIALLFLAHPLEERLQCGGLVELFGLAQIAHLSSQPFFTHLFHFIVLRLLFRKHAIDVRKIVLSEGCLYHTL